MNDDFRQMNPCPAGKAGVCSAAAALMRKLVTGAARDIRRDRQRGAR
jgi:hypothetical protein